MAHLNDRDRSISEAVVRVVAYARGLLSSVAKTRSIIAAATKIDPFPNTKPEGAPVDFQTTQDAACKAHLSLFRLSFR